tara:strand:+ start:1148 stop:1567 length:420 start_codon:yes stop_codon:yes gene_type:complete
MSEFPNHRYTAGLRNVGSYQVSGHPYATGSVLTAGQEFKVEFPTVTRTVTLIASGTNPNLRVHFAAAAASEFVHDRKHYITLPANKDALTVNIKCKEVYVTQVGNSPAIDGTTGFELFASLTNIPTGSMYELTGSGLTS